MVNLVKGAREIPTGKVETLNKGRVCERKKSFASFICSILTPFQQAISTLRSWSIKRRITLLPCKVRNFLHPSQESNLENKYLALPNEAHVLIFSHLKEIEDIKKMALVHRRFKDPVSLSLKDRAAQVTKSITETIELACFFDEGLQKAALGWRLFAQEPSKEGKGLKFKFDIEKWREKLKEISKSDALTYDGDKLMKDCHLDLVGAIAGYDVKVPLSEQRLTDCHADLCFREVITSISEGLDQQRARKVNQIIDEVKRKHLEKNEFYLVFLTTVTVIAEIGRKKRLAEAQASS